MATATVARPAQPLRQPRRDGPRPNLNKRPTNNMDGTNEPASKRRKLEEPYVRTSAHILQKHKGKPPSLIIHLHDAFFRFDGQEGSWPYDSPMKFMIEHLRNMTVPHQLLEELLAGNVPFYDGCLIVEIHNHRTVGGKEKSRKVAGAGSDAVKFSMHNYNEHVTPSGLVPYPKKARTEEESKSKDADKDKGEMAAPDKPIKQEEDAGPKISTIVLHPTSLTQHHELLILANTPTESRVSRSDADGHASTSVPPTPVTATSRGPLSQAQKMALDEGNYYTFQADLLVATEPPLYLEPAASAEESDAIIEMLSNPLHSAKPPSPKTRKRTTAEMAADDAQAAESERRMLIMDERIKPSARGGTGAATNENQSTAASLGFSRFKTLEMVRQKHEEQERLKKEEEARVEAEKRLASEKTTQQAQAKLMQQKMARLANQPNQAQANMLMAQQQQRNEILRQQQQQQQQLAAVQRQMAAADHAQQNNMMQGNQQGNFQHPGPVPQGSPIARQPTPMMNSSPMMPNGGFPMVQTSSQGPGSPPRPNSAAMQNRNVAMARQASQQHSSQHGTPQLPQGTPNMVAAMPNRQMSQTPRLPPGSPATAMHGTPTQMNMGTPQLPQVSQLTPEQVAMLQATQNMQHQGQQGRMNAGSPPHGMTPEQIQQIQNRAQAQARQAAALMQQQGQSPQVVQAHYQAQRAQIMRQAMQQQTMRQQQLQAQQNGMAGSPAGMMQQTPQMQHAHPQTPGGQPNLGNMGDGQQGMATPQQQAAAQHKAQQIAMQRHALAQVNQLAQQYRGVQNVPPNVIATMNGMQQMILRQQVQQKRNLQTQAMRTQAQQQQQQMAASGEQVPAQQPNPQYMQALRAQQAAMMAQMTGQQQNGGGAGGNNAQMNAMAMNMNMGNMGQQSFGNVQNGGDLSQHFANMQNALNQQQRGQ